MSDTWLDRVWRRLAGPLSDHEHEHVHEVALPHAPTEYADDQCFATDWEDTGLGDPDVATSVLELIISYPDWVHRRKEQAEILSETHIKWRSSIDFTIPDLGRPQVAWQGARRTALVPLDVLAKAPLTSFDARNEADEVIPVLTRRQNSILASCAIQEWAAGIALGAGLTLQPSTLALLRDVVGGDPTAAQSHLAELQKSTDPAEAALVTDEGFMATVQWLSTSFLLVAMLRAEPGDRRVLKYSYERSFGQLPGSERRTRRDRLEQQMALEPTTIFLPVPMFRDCESFHFEASAPQGTHFVEKALVDLNLGEAGGATQATVADVDPARTVGYQNLSKSSPHVAHLATNRTSFDAPPTDPADYLEPTIVLSLRLDRNTWLRSAGMAVAFVTAFLWFSLPFVVGWHAVEGGIQCQSVEIARKDILTCTPRSQESPLNADPAALMVGLVGVISLAVVRSGEHAYTSRLVRPLRLVAVIAASLPIAAAWLIVFPGPGSRLLSYGWVILCILAAAAAGIMALAYRQKTPDPARLSQAVATDKVEPER